MTFGQFALWFFYCLLIAHGVTLALRVVAKLLRH